MAEDDLDLREEDDDTLDDWYEAYEALYGEPPERPRRAASRRVAAPEPPPAAAPSEEESLPMSYHPGRFERVWLTSSLRPLYQQALVADVLSHVKGGKEASVYCCRPAEAGGEGLLAAKVYRPREFRNLRNDKMYREGRPVLTASGRPAKKTDHRLMRAIGKKTAFGVQVEHTSWLMYEYTTLERLHNAGAAVPKPIGSSENAILMEYRGDEDTPAPALSHIRLDRDEAEPLFEEVLRNIALMLDLGMIHGDLSAYNILYWEGWITLIDFPQVTSREGNSNAAFILRRDITRVCEYFTAQGVCCDAEAIMARLWRPEWNPE